MQIQWEKIQVSTESDSYQIWIGYYHQNTIVIEIQAGKNTGSNPTSLLDDPEDYQQVSIIAYRTHELKKLHLQNEAEQKTVDLAQLQGIANILESYGGDYKLAYSALG